MFFLIFRVMGWIIRFINNRDLAVENIAVAISRQSLLGHCPPDLLVRMHDRMERAQAAGIPKLSARSYLVPTSEALAAKGPNAGMFGVSLKPSRRNTKQVPVTSGLRNAIRANSPRPLSGDVTTVTRYVGGVFINGGNPWKAGQYCEFRETASRHRQDQADDESGLKVAQIQAFYVAGRGRNKVIYARVQMFTSELRGGQTHLVRGGRAENATYRYICIDSITCRIARCEDWADAAEANNRNRWCGVRTFTAL